MPFGDSGGEVEGSLPCCGRGLPCPGIGGAAVPLACRGCGFARPSFGLFLFACRFRGPRDGTCSADSGADAEACVREVGGLDAGRGGWSAAADGPVFN